MQPACAALRHCCSEPSEANALISAAAQSIRHVEASAALAELAELLNRHDGLIPARAHQETTESLPVISSAPADPQELKSLERRMSSLSMT